MRKKVTKNKYQKFSFALVFFVFLIAILIAVFSGKYWNGVDKFSFVSTRENGDIGVTVLDPRLSEETTIVIPSDTLVEVSRGYGLMKIKNVWQLSENEKIGGDLLMETVMKNFSFPVKFYWNKSGNNLYFIDRLKATIFMKKLSDLDKTEINMATSQYLKKSKLVDGTDGYKLVGPISERLTSYFSDNKIGESDLKIKITDFTGQNGVSDQIGGILEVIGGKVVSIDREKLNKNLDCEAFGLNSDAVKKAVQFFGCVKVSENSNFDLEVRIGGKFSSRF